ncbi:MAG: beta-lactamase family protein [Gemmatimonadaceae bacterium]|nr:beta-lactamase family protein [Gemmatimonadaceae bacterium]
MIAISTLFALLLQVPDSAAFARAANYAASTDGQAVLVMHRGRTVYETYMAGGSASKRSGLASGSKSFVGVAALAAVADGKLNLDRPVGDYLPEWRNDPAKQRITVRQVLSLESGMQSGNPGTGCGGPGKTWTDAINAGTFAAPGEQFRYGPYPFIVGGAVIEKVTGERFEDYLERRILKPLGIRVDWVLKCGDGKPQLAGGASTTARDWAVFGEFVRRDGEYNGRRILPPGLVRELYQPSGANPNYGMSWWLVGAALQRNPAMGIEQADGGGIGGGRMGGAGGKGRAGGRAGGLGGRLGALRRARAARRGGGGGGEEGSRIGTGPGAPMPAWMPADLFMAAGMGKQRLYVIPSMELIVVRMGPITGGRQFTDLAFLEALLGPRVGGASRLR